MPETRRYGVDGSEARSSAFSRLLPTVLKSIVAYLLGILVCVLVTDVKLRLAGVELWLWYGMASPLGVPLYFVAAFQELPTLPFEMWWVIGVLAVAGVPEAFVFFGGSVTARSWRPLWIGFPIGFVGTLGLYWAGSLSI